MTVYNSVILLETGVPLANTTPRPPVTSSRYRHFINISLLRWASDVDNPATFRIFVYKNRFLYAWLSSTNSRSTPSCSKVITSSFRSVFSSLSNLAWRDFRVFSICLMVKFSPRLRFSSSSASVTSSICSCKSRSCRSAEMGIFSN